MNDRVERVRSILVCPSCHAALEDRVNTVSCSACDAVFPVVNGVPWFRSSSEETAEVDYQVGWRGRLRRHPFLYRWAFRLFSPVVVTGPNAAARLAPILSEGGAVLDLGAGNDRRHPAFINVDILPYSEVDIIADGAKLPFAPGSVGGILSICLLEHVTEPQALIAESHRVLRPGGRLFFIVPFIQPFHAAPRDYRRWTILGIEEEVERSGRFHVMDRGVYCGPASGLTWIVAEWLALVLSFGIEGLRRILSPLLQVLISPLKWLDVILAHLPGAADAASVVYVEAEKPTSPPATK